MLCRIKWLYQGHQKHVNLTWTKTVTASKLTPQATHIYEKTECKL